MSDTESKGHRQRLREQFARSEEGSHKVDAIIELFLTLAIRRK